MSSKIFQFSFGDGYAGSAKVAILSSDLLAERGYDVKLFVSKNSLTEKRSIEKKLDFISIDTTQKFSIFSDQILKIFKKEKPEFIISHHSLDRKIGFKLKRKFGNKFINIGYRHNITKSTPIIGPFLYNHYYDCLIACSQGVKQSLINSGTKEEKVKVIYNGISIPENINKITGIEIRNKYNLKDKIVLGLSSWFHKERKGFDILFSAFSKLVSDERFVLLIVGILKQDQNDVYNYAAEFGIDKNKIIMPGYVDNIWEYYKAMDIFLLPSRSEGFSLALLEAAASKLPIIASDIPGTNEFIKDDWNGLLFNVNSSKSLADKIKILCFNDEKRKQFSQNAFALVLKEFLIEQYAHNLDELLQRLRKIIDKF